MSSIELKFFLLFSLGAFVLYTIVDFFTNPDIQTLGFAFLKQSSADEIGFMGKHILIHFRNASISAQIIILLFTASGVYLLTLLVVKPINLVHKKQKYFAANASHELRTPLSVLKTTAEVVRMQGETLTPQEVAEFTKSVIEEVDRMANIIEFFLHFSALENDVALQMSPVNLTSVINRVHTLLSLQAAQNGVTLETTPDGPSMVWGNFTALQEMITNLVKNAILHSPENSTVKVTIQPLEHHIELAVADLGRGISPEDLPHIFEPFYKGETDIKGGRGLGLTIVRELVAMHHAVITTKSELGKGTTFTVRFPRYT